MRRLKWKSFAFCCASMRSRTTRKVTRTMEAKEERNKFELPERFELRPPPSSPILLELIAKPHNDQTLCGRLTLVNRGSATVFYRLKVAGYTKGVSAIGARGHVVPDAEQALVILLTPEAADKAKLRLKIGVEGDDFDYSVQLSLACPAPPTSSASMVIDAVVSEAGDASTRLRDSIDACVRDVVADVFARMATLARSQSHPTSTSLVPDWRHVSDVIMDQVSKHMRRRIHHHPDHDKQIYPNFHFDPFS